jgi:hypothetical protein
LVLIFIIFETGNLPPPLIRNAGTMRSTESSHLLQEIERASLEVAALGGSGLQQRAASKSAAAALHQPCRMAGSTLAAKNALRIHEQ